MSDEDDMTAGNTNSRYEPSVEDRRRDALYQAVNVCGSKGDPIAVIQAAQLFVKFMKDG
jgi:hypothetical protein